MQKTVLAIAALATLVACASKPAPAPTPETATTTTSEAPRGPVPGSVADFETVGNRVYFAYDQYDLSPEARASLDHQAAWLRHYPSVRVLIGGNCDERGTREYNLALGARRAAAARDYLLSLGISGDRMATVSYGKERPIAPGSNEQAWSVNRNATTQIVSGAVS